MANNYQSQPARQDKGTSIWPGIMIGLLIGLASAAVIAVWVGRNNPFADRATSQSNKTVSTTTASQPTGAIVDPLEKATPASNAPHFDFYKILPGDGTQAGNNQPKQLPVAAQAEQYYLQAGAFPNAEDADNLKARLALMGFEAAIQTVDIPDKGVWHRVRLGPYRADEINKVQASLVENDIHTSVVKIKVANNAPQPEQN